MIAHFKDWSFGQSFFMEIGNIFSKQEGVPPIPGNDQIIEQQRVYFPAVIVARKLFQKLYVSQNL